jgi:hypothetical protein
MRLGLCTGPIVQPRPPAIFIACSLGLDFLNSIATPVDTPIDWLDNGDELMKWLAQAKLVPADALGGLKARAWPGELEKVADEARALRGFVRKHMGRRLPPKAFRELGPLNKLLKRDETSARYRGIGSAMEIGSNCEPFGAGKLLNLCYCRSSRRWQNLCAKKISPPSKRARGTSAPWCSPTIPRGE